MDENENKAENRKKLGAITEIQSIENNAQLLVNKAREDANKKINYVIESSDKRILSAKTSAENEKKEYINKLINNLESKALSTLKEAKEKSAEIKKKHLNKEEREKLIKEFNSTLK